MVLLEEKCNKMSIKKNVRTLYTHQKVSLIFQRKANTLTRPSTLSMLIETSYFG